MSAWCMSVSCHKGVVVSPHPSTHEGCGLWFMCLIMKVNHKYNKKHYRWTLFLLSVGISVRNHRITEPSASAALGDTAELQFSAAKALMSNEVWNCDETKPSLVPLLVKNLNVFILLAVFLKGCTAVSKLNRYNAAILKTFFSHKVKKTKEVLSRYDSLT